MNPLYSWTVGVIVAGSLTAAAVGVAAETPAAQGSSTASQEHELTGLLATQQQLDAELASRASAVSPSPAVVPTTIVPTSSSARVGSGGSSRGSVGASPTTNWSPPPTSPPSSTTPTTAAPTTTTTTAPAPTTTTTRPRHDD